MVYIVVVVCVLYAEYEISFHFCQSTNVRELYKDASFTLVFMQHPNGGKQDKKKHKFECGEQHKIKIIILFCCYVWHNVSYSVRQRWVRMRKGKNIQILLSFPTQLNDYSWISKKLRLMLIFYFNIYVIRSVFSMRNPLSHSIFYCLFNIN